MALAGGRAVDALQIVFRPLCSTCISNLVEYQLNTIWGALGVLRKLLILKAGFYISGGFLGCYISGKWILHQRKLDATSAVGLSTKSMKSMTYERILHQRFSEA